MDITVTNLDAMMHKINFTWPSGAGMCHKAKLFLVE